MSGTVALMLQAAPALTPNLVKAILQYTAQPYAGYDALTQGAGFLNAHGAIELARFFAAPSASPYPSRPEWSHQLIWGNHRVSGGRLTPGANAWSSDVAWGEPSTPAGNGIAWGVVWSGGGPLPGAWTKWGAECLDPYLHRRGLGPGPLRERRLGIGVRWRGLSVRHTRVGQSDGDAYVVWAHVGRRGYRGLGDQTKQIPWSGAPT